MFRTFARKYLPNPWDRFLRRLTRKGGSKILLVWNRGLGDIPLGLYALVQRIRHWIPKAEITFLTRKDLEEGFSFLEGVSVYGVSSWKRGEKVQVEEALTSLGLRRASFDAVVEDPRPTDWVFGQIGQLVPRLKADPVSFSWNFSKEYTYIGVQLSVETPHGPWRSWPFDSWKELLELLRLFPKVRVLLLGSGQEPVVSGPHLIDLRGKTSLKELFSLIKEYCSALVLPDSGILSMLYYWEQDFPLRIVSLWSGPAQGVLKQAVPSPNPQLAHIPLQVAKGEIHRIEPAQVIQALFPMKPLSRFAKAEQVCVQPVHRSACVLLAGGQGSRLGGCLSKGLFSVEGKSLFEWICKREPIPLGPLLVMTSPLNHNAIVEYFQRHAYFGFRMHFFQQKLLPVLNERGEKLLDSSGRWIEAPCGNGDLFASLVSSGLADHLAEQGINLLTILPVDNPLARPFDPTLISHHREKGAEITIKCVERRETERFVGLIVERGGKVEVAEYLDVSSSVFEEKTSEGQLLYSLANTGQFCIDLSFVFHVAKMSLPVRRVKKTMEIEGLSCLVWKQERLILDAFRQAKQVEALLSPRAECYAPIKERRSVAEVEKILRGEIWQN